MSDDAILSDAIDLLRRIRQWDQLPDTADGPYWMRQIDELLARVEPRLDFDVEVSAPASEGFTSVTIRTRARNQDEARRAACAMVESQLPVMWEQVRPIDVTVRPVDSYLETSWDKDRWEAKEKVQ